MPLQTYLFEFRYRSVREIWCVLGNSFNCPPIFFLSSTEQWTRPSAWCHRVAEFSKTTKQNDGKTRANMLSRWEPGRLTINFGQLNIDFSQNLNHNFTVAIDWQLDYLIWFWDPWSSVNWIRCSKKVGAAGNRTSASPATLCTRVLLIVPWSHSTPF